MHAESLPRHNKPVPWLRVVFWTLAIFLAWNWRGILPVLQNGELIGPDDFLRLHQVQNWISGQGWYDLTAHRMAPPAGGDIHWSRLVDLPVAALIILFGFFVEMEMAGRIVAMVWPLILFLATTITIVAICDRICGNYNRLLAVFFIAVCTSSIQEFAVGRLDHHNLQILLFTLVILALVIQPGLKANILLGILVPLSMTIGLDSALLFLPVLAFLGFEWAMGRQGAKSRLFVTGVTIGIASLVFYALSFRPEDWFDARCDAFSLYYLTSLVLLAASFVLLALLGEFSGANTKYMPCFRLLTGSLLAVVCIGALVVMFPQCASGPLEALGDEAKARWLGNVDEAKGLLDALKTSPERWFSDLAYMLLMLLVCGFAVTRQIAKAPQLGVLFFIVVICAFGMFIQIRILRTGVYAVIPFCVIFATLSWVWLEARFPEEKARAVLSQAAVCVLLTSLFWSLAGNLVFANDDKDAETISQVSGSADEPSNGSAAPAQELHHIYRKDFCFRKQDMANLAALEPGLVMSDLNTAPALLVHTGHSVVSGPYHRNEAAILSVLDFFDTTIPKAQAIAKIRNIDYIAYCTAHNPHPAGLASESLGAHILRDELPEWLEWLSGTQARLRVMRVVRQDAPSFNN